MKKYKVRFSIFNLMSATQSEIASLQTYVKTLTAMVAGTAWYTMKPEYSLYIGALGFFLDTLLHCLYLEEKK